MACFSGTFCLTCTALCTAALTFQQCLWNSTAALQVMPHNLTTTLHEHCSTARSGPQLSLCTLPPHSTHAPPILTQHLPCSTARSEPPMSLCTLPPHSTHTPPILTQHLPCSTARSGPPLSLCTLPPHSTHAPPSSLNACPSLLTQRMPLPPSPNTCHVVPPDAKHSPAHTR